MDISQPGILLPVPQCCRYLTFGLIPGAEPTQALTDLKELGIGETMVVGIGKSVVSALGHEVPGLRSFPSLVGPGVDIPATPAGLWIWLRGEDPGKLVHTTNRLKSLLSSAFRLDEVMGGFKYDETPEGLGRDLSGYEDGTENPEDAEAEEAAVVSGMGEGLDGSSFVATQKWVHELSIFNRMSEKERDNVIGRRSSDNEELDDAPDSAHVKRTAQEDFEPEAFVVRRSMPWADAGGEGLEFVSFGASLDAFEAQLTRMSGLEDGTVDALFRFSRPVTGAYFWCPPVSEGKLNLDAIGI
ncbi:MAG: Dyp-type peroxidase [Gemmatimonadota bacterium]|jgi:putative iron-dependent peroxidase